MTLVTTMEWNGATFGVHKPEPATTAKICVRCMNLIQIGNVLTRLEVVDPEGMYRGDRFPKFHKNCFDEFIAGGGSQQAIREEPTSLQCGEWKVTTYGKGNHWVIDPSGDRFQPFSVREKAEGFVEMMNNLNGGQIVILKDFLN